MKRISFQTKFNYLTSKVTGNSYGICDPLWVELLYLKTYVERIPIEDWVELHDVEDDVYDESKYFFNRNMGDTYGWDVLIDTDEELDPMKIELHINKIRLGNQTYDNVCRITYDGKECDTRI